MVSDGVLVLVWGIFLSDEFTLVWLFCGMGVTGVCVCVCVCVLFPLFKLPCGAFERAGSMKTTNCCTLLKQLGKICLW